MRRDYWNYFVIPCAESTVAITRRRRLGLTLNAHELRSEEGRLKGQAKRSERFFHRRSFCSLCFLDLMTSLECGGSSTALLALLALLAFLDLMTSLECGGCSTALLSLFLFLPFLI
jgi:hypothetical protein